MAACWTPESRDMMARDLAATAAFGLFDVPQSAVQELFKRHGLDDIERKGPKAFEDVDRVAFLAEMWALLDTSGDDDEAMPGIVGSTLADLKVQGGKATGDLVTTREGKEHRQGIEFHQIDGGWFVYGVLPDPEGLPSDYSDESRSGKRVRIDFPAALQQAGRLHGLDSGRLLLLGSRQRRRARLGCVHGSVSLLMPPACLTCT